MRLVITKDYREMTEWGARYIKKRINDFKPGPDRFFVLGLPTGMSCDLLLITKCFTFLDFLWVVHLWVLLKD
jgi:6-phosphogluconolactonase/glucosamine-6-phosphate isomerase/deaminase